MYIFFILLYITMRCLATIKDSNGFDTNEQCLNNAKKIGKIDTYCFIHYKQKYINHKDNLDAMRRDSLIYHHKRLDKKNKKGGDEWDKNSVSQYFINNLNNILSDNFKSKYTIIKHVAKTMMSDVFLIKENSTNKEYILKIYFVILDNKKYKKQELEYFTMMLEKIKTEYELMNELDHPQIIKLKKTDNFETVNTKNYKYSYIIVEKYEESLSERFKRKLNKLSENDIKSIGYQLINIIKYLHIKKYLYLDFSLNNIMFFSKDNNKIVLIDLGMVESYYKGSTIREFVPGVHTYGTPLYSSKNATKGNLADRVDDIESIFYILCHLYLEYLPWGVYLPDYSEKSMSLTYNSKITFSESKDYKSLPGWLKKYYNILETYKYYQEVPEYDLLLEVLL